MNWKFRFKLNILLQLFLQLRCITEVAASKSIQRIPNPIDLFSEVKRIKFNDIFRQDRVSEPEPYSDVTEEVEEDKEEHYEDEKTITTEAPTSNNSTEVSNSNSEAHRPPPLSYIILKSLFSIIFGSPSSQSNYSNSQQQQYQPQNQSTSISNLFKLILFLSAIPHNYFMSRQNKAFSPPVTQHFMFERINERYERDSLALLQSLNPLSKNPRFWSSGDQLNSPSPRVKLPMNQLRRFTKRNKNDKTHTSIILELKTSELTDVDIDDFCDKITFILTQYYSRFAPQPNHKAKKGKRSKSRANHNEGQSPSLEVILLLESPGGVVQDFGLLASQLSRLRNISNITNSNHNNQIDDNNHTESDEVSCVPSPIQLTICVDKIAASGGYMLASQASPNSLFASQFACIGSIGVITERVNFSKLLKKWGVRSLRFASSKGKNPVGPYDEITEEGQAVVQEGIDRTFDAFKEYVKVGRNMTDEQVDKVATGEVWLGSQALELDLVDNIKTSDEYILEKILQQDTVVLKLMKYEKTKASIGLGNFSLLDLLLLKKDGGNTMKKIQWDKFGTSFLKVLALCGVSSNLMKQGPIYEISRSFVRHLCQ